MQRKLLIALSLAISTTAFADTTIVKETQTWKSVPITVDAKEHTYVVGNEPLPTDNYYYSYSGYRCLKEKNDAIGVDALIFHAHVGGGSDIYCYPE